MTTSTKQNLIDIIDSLNLHAKESGIAFDASTVQLAVAGYDDEAAAKVYRFVDAVQTSARAAGYRAGYTDGRFDATQAATARLANGR